MKTLSGRRYKAVLLFLAFLLVGAGGVFCDDYSWDGEADTDWSNAVNWYNDTTTTNDDGYPAGVGDTATFGDYTVTLTNIPAGTMDAVTINTSGTITLGADLNTTAMTLSAGTLNDGGNTITAVGAVDLSGGTFTSTGTFTLSGGAAQTVAGNITFNNLSISKSGGSASFSGNLTTSTDLTTASAAYDISFTGGTNSFTAAAPPVAFNNTGTLTLGNGGDDFTFDGGLTATAPGTL
ncbi:MAG: hypothetical protein JW760_14660, partial [Spirochaetales bacterium]|nr:hypothetical protein [Spirochaetales bacterium]